LIVFETTFEKELSTPALFTAVTVKYHVAGASPSTTYVARPGLFSVTVFG